MDARYTTLTEMLRAAAVHAPAAAGYTFLGDGGPVHLPYAALWDDAVALAGALQGRGVQHGDRIVLTLPTGPTFARLYLALQLCGAAPCVLPPAGKGSAGAPSRERIVDVARHLGAAAIIAGDGDREALADQGASSAVWAPAQIVARDAASWAPVAQRGEDIAVIQATSGSTGVPKCVMLTQHNILSNLDQIGRRLRADQGGDVVVCWLPLFHDMGLIGCFLFSAYWRLRGVLMDPMRFLRDPANWLRAISDYRGTLSPAPNFAYALAAERAPAAALDGLDLASWRAAMCGAEPISAGVLRQFAARFAGCGFHPDALVPCYGLAEAALCVAMHRPGEPLRTERISRRALAHRREAIPAAASDEDATIVCDCGLPVEGTHLRIATDDGSPLPEGRLGHVLVSGPSVMARYHALPEGTGVALRDGWLWTGDLGYLRDGRFFVTGRAKDLIIIRGQNYPPSEFEWAAEEIPGVRPGRVAAFGAPDPDRGTEQLYVICEQPRDRDLDAEGLRRAIQAHIARRTGVWPAHVGLVPRNAIPRTTSGKVQRSLAKARYLAEQHQGAPALATARR